MASPQVICKVLCLTINDLVKVSLLAETFFTLISQARTIINMTFPWFSSYLTVCSVWETRGLY